MRIKSSGQVHTLYRYGGQVDGKTIEVKIGVVAGPLPDAIPMVHHSLWLPLGDHIEDGQWAVVAADYMQRMGFSAAHPYCVWAHDDESAIHIVTSRIGFDDRVSAVGRQDEDLIWAATQTRPLQLTQAGPDLGPLEEAK